MGKIIGDIAGTPNPQPDWSQNDETKADYIKNKPNLSLLSLDVANHESRIKDNTRDINSLKYYGDVNIVPTEKKEYIDGNYTIIHCYFNYTDNGDGTCTITGWNDMIVDVFSVVVPYEIDGLTVTKIGSGAFEMSGLDTIILPNTVTSLESRSPFLESITIPDSVTTISPNIFSELQSLVIHCNPGSYAQTYAIENGIKYDNGTPEVDQQYNPDSENAQSGKAVAEALTHKIMELTVDGDGFCVIPDFKGSTAVFSLSLDALGCEFDLPGVQVGEFKQILLHISAVGEPPINWGTNIFFNEEIPYVDYGTYDFIFEWDGYNQEWCAGAILKGLGE